MRMCFLFSKILYKSEAGSKRASCPSLNDCFAPIKQYSKTQNCGIFDLFIKHHKLYIYVIVCTLGYTRCAKILIHDKNYISPEYSTTGCSLNIVFFP